MLNNNSQELLDTWPECWMGEEEMREGHKKAMEALLPNYWQNSKKDQPALYQHIGQKNSLFCVLNTTLVTTEKNHYLLVPGEIFQDRHATDFFQWHRFVMLPNCVCH